MTDKDIIEKDFNRAFHGYDIQEVDSFLDEVIRELKRREDERAYLELRIELLTQELARQDQPALPKPPKTAPGTKTNAPDAKTAPGAKTNAPDAKTAPGAAAVPAES